MNIDHVEESSQALASIESLDVLVCMIKAFVLFHKGKSYDQLLFCFQV